MLTWLEDYGGVMTDERIGESDGLAGWVRTLIRGSFDC